jgi:hypothetical protein
MHGFCKWPQILLTGRATKPFELRSDPPRLFPSKAESILY